MRVHFIAIAGVGMGSLAGLFKRRGFEVTGSDEGVYPPMSDALAAWGIPVQTGFRAANLPTPPPDLVVIGNAVRADNPEAQAARAAGLHCLSFPDALYEHALRERHKVVVAGTHGKTTTTSLIAALLEKAGRDPSLLLGGYALDFGGGFRDGAGPEFVVEGDEYDTAFFDKTPKFLHYHPDTLVLTSIEFDHADIYADLAQVKAAFAQLVRGLAPEACVIAAAPSAALDDVLREARARVLRYGVEPDAPEGVDFRARALRVSEDGTHFELDAPCADARALPVTLPAFGRFNVANALAALAALHTRGVPVREAARALRTWRGVKRRQEVRFEAGGITLVDDFAHHPTAVRETLHALRARFSGRRLFAAFDPRSNTSRRAVFQDEYARAFDAADGVWLRRPEARALYSAFGEAPARLDLARLAADIRKGGTRAEVCDDVPAIVAALARACAPGDVVVTLSNGGFDDIWNQLRAQLETN